MSQSEHLQFSRLADLDCLAMPLRAERPTIIMLHGYGANFEDLAGLAPMLDPKQQWNWIFPNGILEVPIGPHMVGRAWFPIDMEALQRHLMGGEVRSFADLIPKGLEAAQNCLLQLISALKIKPEDLVLAGFSQGAMVSCHTMLAIEQNPRALVQLSSTLVSEPTCLARMPMHRELPIFQSHGQNDPILPVAAARDLKQIFSSASSQVEYHEFPGAHEIPLPIIQKLAAFLQRLT